MAPGPVFSGHGTMGDDRRSPQLVHSLWKDNIFARFMLTALHDLGFSEDDS